MIRAIIFDFGGTLVLTKDAVIESMLRSLEINKVPLPPEEKIVKNMGKCSLVTIRKIIPKDYPDYEVTVKKCFNTHQRIFPSEFLDYFKEVDGVKETLKYLLSNNFKLGLLTGWKGREIKPILKFFQWSELFDTIITLDDYHHPRPAPDCVQVIADKLGVKTDDIMYVGDTIDDIGAGKAAKAKTVAVLTGAQSREMLEKEKPDFIIESVKDLKNIIGEVKK